MKTLVLCCVGLLAISATAQPVGQSAPTNLQTNSDTNKAPVHFKLVGDETHISAIKASPRSFLRKTVTIVGGIRTANYYNYSYENAQSTHFSLRFEELTENRKIIGDLTVYAKRSFSKPLVDAILKNEATGDGKLVRLKIAVTSRSIDNNDFSENAELEDWQFWDTSTDNWTPWAKESMAIEAAKARLQQDAIDRVAQEKARAEAQVRIAEQKRTAATSALKANQDAAAKGDSYGLMRMGQRYRDGDGVEKDLAKAKEYLQKAADAGSPTAKDELQKLNQP